jgi:tetratricopeptide (TPR) repeat protein
MFVVMPDEHSRLRRTTAPSRPVTFRMIAVLTGLGAALPGAGLEQIEDPAVRIASMAARKDWRGVASAAGAWAREKPRDAIAYYWLGVALWHGDDTTGSIQALRRAEGLGLNTAVLHKTLGLAYYSINQFILFRRQMEKAAELDPKDAQPHFHIGRYLESVPHDYAQALAHFEKAILLDPGDGRSAVYRAYCLEMLGRSDQARDGYEASIRLLESRAEKFSWPCYRLAEMMRSANDVPQSLAWARRAVALEPDAAINHYELGKIRMDMDDPGEALQELRAAVRLDPKSTAAHYLLARVYAALGRDEAARAERKLYDRLKSAYGTE